MTGFRDDLRNRCTLGLYPNVRLEQKTRYGRKALYSLALQDSGNSIAERISAFSVLFGALFSFHDYLLKQKSAVDAYSA